MGALWGRVVGAHCGGVMELIKLHGEQKLKIQGHIGLFNF